MNTGNLFKGIPTDLDDEWFQILVQGKQTTIERIVSQGHCSPQGFWYDQDWDEWVTVVQGEAELEMQGQKDLVRLTKGDHLLIPAHVKHRVAWTSANPPTIWLAVHINRPVRGAD
jgi:cupin 2 domain-containing protein